MLAETKSLNCDMVAKDCGGNVSTSLLTIIKTNKDNIPNIATIVIC